MTDPKEATMPDAGLVEALEKIAKDGSCPNGDVHLQRIALDALAQHALSSARVAALTQSPVTDVEHEPGLGWKISKEARDKIEDLISYNVHNAAALHGLVLATLPPRDAAAPPSPDMENRGDEPSSDASVSASPAADVVQHWGVDVRINGERVLTIESEHLTGISDIDLYADTVRNCAAHLLSFIGDGKPTSCFACGGSGQERVLGPDGAEVVIACSICVGAESERALRPEVVAFADLMERELRSNDHKGGWTNDQPVDLLIRLREETNELHEELRSGSRTSLDAWRSRVGAEAADVANFAMMIADVCGALPSVAGQSLNGLAQDGSSQQNDIPSPDRQGEVSWLKFLPSDKEWLADHGRKMGSGIGQQAIERLLIALDHVAAESSRDDLLRQLEEAKEEVEVLRENFAQERLLKNTAHVELIRAGREIEEWRASAAGYGSDALAEKVLREQAEAERDNLGESMRNYARYSELYLERAETAEAQVAALTAQRDALLEWGNGAYAAMGSITEVNKEAADATIASRAAFRALRTAHEAAAQAGEVKS